MNHVEKANEALAIESLLVTDELFRFVFIVMWIDVSVVGIE